MPDTAQQAASCPPACGALSSWTTRTRSGESYGAQPAWDGLALVSEAFVPHYQAPGHPETAAMELVVARYRAEAVAYRTLHDGQALLIDGPYAAIA